MDSTDDPDWIQSLRQSHSNLPLQEVNSISITPLIQTNRPSSSRIRKTEIQSITDIPSSSQNTVKTLDQDELMTAMINGMNVLLSKPSEYSRPRSVRSGERKGSKDLSSNITISTDLEKIISEQVNNNLLSESTEKRDDRISSQTDNLSTVVKSSISISGDAKYKKRFDKINQVSAHFK
jgi:hypothetical protein